MATKQLLYNYFVFESGFIKMLKIPAKARHITIREISTNNNNNLNLLGQLS